MKFLILIFICQLAIVLIVAEESNQRWVKPNAWAKFHLENAEEQQQVCDCNSLMVLPAEGCPEMDEDHKLGVMFYKKLVNFIFQKTKMIENDFDSSYLLKFHFQVSKDQWRRLQTSKSVRDIDAIVSDVIETSKGGFIMETKEILMSWVERAHYIYLRIINSNMLTMVVLTIGFFACTSYFTKIMKYNLIGSLIFTACLISLIFDYMACNRKLEVENTIKLMTASESNPCDTKATYFFGLFSSFDSAKCTEHMLTLHGHNRQICSPSDVISDFFMKVFFKPFEMFLDTMLRFSNNAIKNSWLKGIPVLIILLTFLAFLVKPLIKETMKFIFFSLRAPNNEQIQKIASRPEVETLSQKIDKLLESSGKPPVVNINIDSKAIGDYVQVLRDSPQKIENSKPEADEEEIESIQSSPSTSKTPACSGDGLFNSE